MHLASLFAPFSRPALRCGVSARVLMVLALGAGSVGAAHAGTTYTFGGAKIDGCDRSGKVYTCASAKLPNWDDNAIIQDGYTVNVQSDVSFGWDQGLTMSGTARLTSTGNLNLSGMNPANLRVSGGSFSAGGTFTVTGPTEVKADVSAGKLVLGTGSALQISGTMVSRGEVAVGSNATIDGPVSGTAITTSSPFTITGAVTASDKLLVASGGTIGGAVVGTNAITINSPATLKSTVTSQGPVTIGSNAVIGGAIKGSVVTAASPVTLKGGVTASSRFTLGSGSTVTGNIVAPEVELYAAGSNITGNVTASTYLTMGSSVKITGTVDTGQLKMEASDALIDGVAKVDFAKLFWNGRVSQNIVCKTGTRAGECDCVQNESGNPLNSADGPRCESGKKNTSALHHFLITHDGSGQTCGAESVSVTACANQACSAPHFDGGARVTLQPGGAVLDVGSSGVAFGEVSRSSAGVEALRLTYSGNTSDATTCRNSSTGAASCDMTFAGGVAFNIEVAPYRAGEGGSAIIKALQSDPKTNQCVKAFQNSDKALQYSCAHATASKGNAALTVAGTSLSCEKSAKQAIATRFDANGVAKLALGYPDVGRIKLMAELDDAKGETTFTVAPHRFGFTDLPVAALGQVLRAGDDVTVTISALNAQGAITPSFDKAALATDGATRSAFALACVAKGDAGTLDMGATEFEAGKARPKLTWSEVGAFDLNATLNDFLGSKLAVTGTSNTAASGCSARVGPFIPKYFLVDQPKLELDKARTFYYAGEPVPTRISAMNAQGAVTRNYAALLGYSSAVTLGAFDAETRSQQNPGGGALLQNAVAASAFIDGVALAAPVYGPPAESLLAPTRVVLRAATGAPLVTSDDAGKGSYETVRTEMRSGRLRIGSKAGRVGEALALQIALDYWSGKSWLFNEKDNVTTFPMSAFAQSASPKVGASVKPQVNTLNGKIEIKKGSSELKLTGNAPGWIDVALNLGDGAGKDLSCAGTHPIVTGAAAPWLRLPKGCRDPAGRVTFGEQAPENRRLIHVREVFN